MRKKSKVLHMLLSVAMLGGITAACSSNNNSEVNSTNEAGQATPADSASDTAAGTASTTPGASVDTSEPYEIVLAFPVFGAVPKDMPAVEEAISKISQEKINASVKILPISIGAWSQQMNLMTSGGEKLDIAYAFGQQGYYSTQASTGKIIAIDDLLPTFGSDIEEAVGTEYLSSAKFNGKLYGVPTLHSFTMLPGVYMRKDLVEKNGIDTSAIKNLDDLNPVLQTIKDNEPGVTPLGVGLNNPFDFYVDYDKLGDRFGIIPKFDNGLKVENLFETQEYENLLTKVHSWFKSGFINKDAATTQTPVQDLMKAGKTFSYFSTISPGGLEIEQRLTGKELIYVPLFEQPYTTTNVVLNGLYTISQNSENPERTMMFLNLMYSDKEIANLLAWGIEGTDYVKVSDNIIDYPKGIDSTTVGYSMPVHMVGNPFLTYIFNNDDPDKWIKTKADNDAALKSKALGFTFDAEPVKNEMTAINNVMEQYRRALESGTIDPANKLQEFRNKLKAAGLDKVIAEKQKQLDEWATNNK
ncbi:Bacterial extracellular solute-binding protein [compost metagenome]